MNVENVYLSGHSPVSQIATHILYILSCTVSPALTSSAGTLSGPVARRLAIWWMAWTTSERSGGGSCSQYYCLIPLPFLSWYKSSQYPIPVWDLFSFSQIFASRWLDTLQMWLKLSRYWFGYLEELPGISFWIRCFQFHAHAFHLLLFIHSELSVSQPVKAVKHRVDLLRIFVAQNHKESDELRTNSLKWRFFL